MHGHQQNLKETSRLPKKVLVVIPAFNEAGRVAAVIRELKSDYPDFDLLVVDDCSNDTTAQEARSAGAKVASLAFNLGIGGAVQTGLKYAQKNNYDIAIQVDADGQHDPAFINEILQPLLSDRLDICVGSRFILQEGFKSSFFRRLGIRFFAGLISLLTGEKLTDPTSGFRAIGPKLIGLFAHNYPVDFPEPESLVMARQFGARIGEVPVVMRKRQGGVSSIRYLKSGYYMLKVTLAIILWRLRKGP